MLNRCFQLKYEKYELKYELMHNIGLSIQWKSRLVWIRREICTNQELWEVKTVLNKYFEDFDVRGQQGLDFFTWGSAIIDFGLAF